MRCLACNKRLNGKESTRKYSSNGQFVDLCDRCYSFVADDVAAVDGEGYIADYDDEGEDGGFEASGDGEFEQETFYKDQTHDDSI